MSHEAYMELALTLARAAKGRTAPNPIVGAVIVKGDRIVGFGAHLRAGTPHAEVHALRMAGEEARGATVYVTLEPCSHYGRTPPCADALIQSGVARVYVAVQDPNPEVAGRGIARLRAAGIAVEVGLCAALAEQDNEPYMHYRRTQRPLVTWKSALSADGFIAPQTHGQSRYLTGTESLATVHRLRDQVDGIAVGVGTILADDPLLTTRLPETTGKNPIRIVFDSRLRTPLDARVVRDRTAKTWLICAHDAAHENERALSEQGVHVLRLTAGPDGRPSLRASLELLAQRGVLDLLLEGGQVLASQFLQERLIDWIWLFHTPVLLGSGVKALTSDLASAVHLSSPRVIDVGDDRLTIARPVYSIS